VTVVFASCWEKLVFAVLIIDVFSVERTGFST